MPNTHDFEPIYYYYDYFDPLEQRQVTELVVNDNAGCERCGCSENHPIHYT